MEAESFFTATEKAGVSSVFETKRKSFKSHSYINQRHLFTLGHDFVISRPTEMNEKIVFIHTILYNTIFLYYLLL